MSVRFKDTLLYLAKNQNLHNFVLHNKTTRNFSRRFVAGEALAEAVNVSRDLNGQGVRVSLDLLGENVSDVGEATATAQNYIAVLDTIQRTGIDANISIKLTHLGLDISQELCEQNVRAILESARGHGVFVRIDMEGSAYTTRTIDMTLRMYEEFAQVGTVIQAYLYHSTKDVEQLIAQGVRVRLVKGAYKEPHNIAFQHKGDVDRNYVQLMIMLLARGNYPAIATHDEAVIDAAIQFAGEQGISNSAFEFQMLYGVRRDLQEKLVRQGYNVRVYVPYGPQWYSYLMRRMAERPANLMFAMSSALR